MAWENSNEIMWGNDNIFLAFNGSTAFDLSFQCPSELHAYITKPVRTMTEYDEEIIYYPNGGINVFFTYSLFPGGMTDNVPLLNAYGQKIYNDFLDKERKEDNNA